MTPVEQLIWAITYCEMEEESRRNYPSRPPFRHVEYAASFAADRIRRLRMCAEEAAAEMGPSSAAFLHEAVGTTPSKP